MQKDLVLFFLVGHATSCLALGSSMVGCSSDESEAAEDSGIIEALDAAAAFDSGGATGSDAANGEDAGEDSASGNDADTSNNVDAGSSTNGGYDGGHTGGQADASSTLDAGVSVDAAQGDDAGSNTAVLCPPLAPASGPTITVTPGQSEQLPSIIAQAALGTTILLEPGNYTMSGDESSRRIRFLKSGLTLRSSTGNRSDVVIDGEYATEEIMTVEADNVTIADLTVRRAVHHLIHATGASGKTIENTHLYNLELLDSGQQFVKVNSDGQGHYADHGALECSHLQMTSAGRPHVDANNGGCYTGGIDAHGAWGWTVRLNRIEGIYCTNGSLAEHAIHFWSASRDSLIEQNVISDCARGIGLGLIENGQTRAYPDDPYSGSGYIGHYDGIVRNNLIFASAEAAPYFDTGIELDQARGTLVCHNTLPSTATFSSIDYRFGNTQVTIRNNLTQRITQRDGAAGQIDHNLENVASSLFRSPPTDFRLRASASSAIDQAIALPESGLDLDGLPHDFGSGPDLGAYEAR